MLEFRNLTPHVVNLFDDEDNIIFELPSEGVARCKQSAEVVDMFDLGDEDISLVPIKRMSFGEIQGLPEEEPNVYNIVSRVVAEAAPHRMDLLMTGDPVRDEDGRIIGCRSFSVLGDFYDC